MITFLCIVVGVLAGSHIILIIRFVDLVKQVRHLQIDAMRQGSNLEMRHSLNKHKDL